MITTKLTFPRTIFVDRNCLHDQLEHIQSELHEACLAHACETPERTAEELVDLYHSVETALRIVDENFVSVEFAMERVAEKNLRRGYYA